MNEQPLCALDRSSGAEGSKPALILVHGTGAAPQDMPEGFGFAFDPSVGNVSDKPKWYQDGSQFDHWLRDRIECGYGPDGENAAFIRFIWSGLNSEKAREEAAAELASLTQSLVREGRCVHFLAHSHGGNVVRRAIELTATGREPAVANIKSVTAFGTPFFHYSKLARLWAVMVTTLVLAAMLGLLARLFQAIEGTKSEDLQTVGILALVMLGGVACYCLGALLVTLFRLSPGRKNTMPDRAKGIDFCNLFSAKDEAIGLLMSFNKPIVLMRRADFIQVWMNGPLGYGFFITLILLFVAAVAGFWEKIGGTFDYMTESVLGFVVTLIAAMLCLLIGAIVVLVLNGILLLALTLPVRLGATVIDHMITRRLKALAFGANAGNGLISVNTYPWAGAEYIARPMPASIETAIEAHIAGNSTELWARIRARLVSGVPLLGQDLPAIVQESLTWDELSHTVYYQIEAFADLIAERLIATGDWQARVGLVEDA